MVTEMARSFAEKELLPHADNWDEHEIFPRETILKAAGLGRSKNAVCAHMMRKSRPAAMF